MSTGAHHVEPHDTFGKKIGILAAVLAVLLSFFTICAHRSHTEALVLQSASNDQWSYYQSKRIRDYQLEMNLDLVKTLGAHNAQTDKLITTYTAKHAQYSKELNTIKEEADAKSHESTLSQKKALYFDFAEGVLEIALVMSSLYFISQKRLFPCLSILFAAIGLIFGILGFLL